MVSTKNVRSLVYDCMLIAIGIVIALVMLKSGLIDLSISLFNDHQALASFVAGIFFTSIFTLAPASAALARIAENAPLPQVAIWGGLGAMCGDLVLFFFIRDRFSEHLMSVFKPSVVKRIFHTLHFGFLKWVSPILGALIIASPLPDEFGLMLMGMSKVRTAVLIPLTFVMNVIGIYLLIFAVSAFR